MAPIRMQVIFSFAAAILVVLPTIAYATDYIVGDDEGWTLQFDYSEWAKDKQFHVGDTLTFIYSEGNHNVIKVDGKGFASCATSPNSGILTSGRDKITLATPGNKWYICGVSGHCDAGQKLKITVLPKSMIGDAPSPAPEVVVPGFSWAPVPVATPGYLLEADIDRVPIPAPDSSVLFPWKPLIPFNPEAPAWPPAAGFLWVPVPAGAR
ncbi:hypothetical protein AAC387_Pa05g3074 [Persea americana]